MADEEKPEAPEMVPAQAPDGTTFKIPVANIAKAKAMGWDVEDPHESLGQQAATVGEGLGRGIVPGFPAAEAFVSKALGSKAGSIEEQKARREVNPVEASGSELVGTGLQMAGVAAATGGLSELGEAGALASKVGEGAEALQPIAEATKAVEGGAEAAEAASGAGASPGAISGAAEAQAAQPAASAAEAGERAVSSPFSNSYVQQAAAGATQGGSEYLNEAQLGDHDFNGEALVQHLGLGALTAVGGEGALNVLRKTIAPPVIRAAGEALDSAGNKLRNLYVKAVETVNPEAAGKVGPAIDAIKGGAKKLTDAEAEGLGNSINRIAENNEAVGKQLEGNRPVEGVNNLKDVAPSDILGAPPGTDGPRGLLKVHAEIEQEMGRIKGLMDSGDYEGKKIFNTAQRALDKFEGVIKNPESTAGELHEATRDFKQAVGNSGIHEENMARSDEAKGLVKDMRQSVWAPLKEATGDAGIWGEEQAGRNVRLDRVTARKMNAEAQLYKDFGASEKDLDTGKKEFYIKSSKVRSAMTGDPLNNQERLEHLQEYIDASRDYVKEAGETAGTAGAVVPGGDDIHDLLESVTAQKEQAQAAGSITNLQRATGGNGDTAAGVLGIGAHALGASVPGAGLLVAAYGAVKNPVRTIQMYAKIAAASAAARDVIGSGVKRMFSSTPGRAAIVGGIESAIRGKTVRSVNGAPAGNDFQKQAKHITALAQDQERQMQTLGDNTARMHDVAPMTTMSTQTTAYRLTQALFERLPKNPAPSLIQSENDEWEPPASELDQWNNTHAVLLHPPRLLDQFADGTATQDAWDAVQEVYPKWATELQQATVSHITDHPNMEMTQDQKYSASMILGQPVSPTVSPDQIAFTQASYLPLPPPPGEPKHRKPTQHGMDKIDLGTRSALGPQSRRKG